MEAHFTDEREPRFRSAVLESNARVDRGPFIEEEMMDARIEQRL